MGSDITIPVHWNGTHFSLTLSESMLASEVLVLGPDGFELAIQRRKDGKFEPVQPDFRFNRSEPEVDKASVRRVVSAMLQTHYADTSLLEVWSDELKRAIGDRA